MTNPAPLASPALPSVADVASWKLSLDEKVQKLKELVEKVHPDASEIWVGEHQVTGEFWLYRGETPAEARVYSKKLGEQTDRKELGDFRTVYDWLALQCVLWPAKEDLSALLVRRPLISEGMAAQIREVSGLHSEITRKKA